MPKEATYRVGAAFPIEDLKKKAQPKPQSERDKAITKAINEASAAAPSQVIPLFLPEGVKVGTAKAAASRLVAAMGASVNVGISKDYPNVILFSRGRLSLRGRRNTASN